MWTSHDCVKHNAPQILHFTKTVRLDLYTACASIYTLRFYVLMTYRLHEYIYHFDSIAESGIGATGAACTSSQHPSPQQALLGRWLQLIIGGIVGVGFVLHCRMDHPKVRQLFSWCSCSRAAGCSRSRAAGCGRCWGAGRSCRCAAGFVRCCTAVCLCSVHLALRIGVQRGQIPVFVCIPDALFHEVGRCLTILCGLLLQEHEVLVAARVGRCQFG